jgi:hypothetical protein
MFTRKTDILKVFRNYDITDTSETKEPTVIKTSAANGTLLTVAKLWFWNFRLPTVRYKYEEPTIFKDSTRKCLNPDQN